MAYDPYAGQTPEQQMSNGSIAKEFLTYGINPSSYATMAMSNPLMWNTKKGVYVPFVGKRWAEGRMKYLGKDLVTGFKNTYTKGVGTAITGTIKGAGNLTKSIFMMGMTDKAGAGWIGGKGLGIDYNSRIKATTRRFERENLKLNNKRMILNDLQRRGLASKDLVQDFMKQKVKASRVERKLVSLASKKNIQLAKKIGFGAAKAGSIIGASMLIYDIASMVAKPLAQTAMGAINQMAMEYQNRFMPEMGGQLQLSYLSQGAATERQRAIQSISKSYINGRSAFGSEGSMMHS